MIKSKILLFLAVCFIGLISSTKAATLTTDYQSNFYSNRFIDNINYSGLLAYAYIDNEIVYCLNPKVIVGKDYTENKSVLEQYTDEQLQYMELLAYYGYNETNNTLEYYAATQQLIWEYLDNNQNYFYWSTEKNSNGEIILINDELLEISNNVKDFYKGVSFENNSYEGYVDDWIILFDENYQLNNYELENPSDDIKIENNQLLIKISAVGLKEIKLRHKLNNNIENKVYSSEGHQNLINFGLNLNKTFSIFVNGIKKEISEEIESDNKIEDDNKEEKIYENISEKDSEEPEKDSEEIIEKEKQIIEDDDNKIEDDNKEENINDEGFISNNIQIKELPNTYNTEYKYYLFSVFTFILGMSVLYKYI